MTGDNREPFTYLTSPYAESEAGDHVPGTPVEANFADAAGQRLTLDSTSLETVFGEPATVSLSPVDGSPVEGARLTVSRLVPSGENTGAPVDHRRRTYSIDRHRAPIALGPDTSTNAVTLPTSAVGPSPASASRPGSDIGALAVVAPDAGGAIGALTRVTMSEAASSVLGAASAATVTPTVSIIGSPIEGSTLRASVIIGGFTGTIAYHWQRFYSSGWWDIPIELSPYSAGEVFTYVTTPTYVVRAEDSNVLGIRVEATYLDKAGQIVTLKSAAKTITEPPKLTAENVTASENVASVALAITDAVHNPGYTLGKEVTIAGVPAGWSLRGDGAARVAAGTWIAGSNSLAALRLVAPPADEAKTFTLSVKASEAAVGPTGATLTATATTHFAVHVTHAAEVPVFGPTNSWSGSEEASITLSGLTARHDGDDALSARISGVAAGWTVIDPGVTTIVGTSGGASGMVGPGDLGRLVVLAP
ncbi:MAG TPA: hypothetical protein VGS13_08345, partial [Stellaceae bacterium]|nr:hypothetical protein [Stellaceae bacterium]